jgi:hypothetical protein
MLDGRPHAASKASTNLLARCFSSLVVSPSSPRTARTTTDLQFPGKLVSLMIANAPEEESFRVRRRLNGPDWIFAE